MIRFLFCGLLVLLCSTVVQAGETDYTDNVVFNTTFNKLVSTFKDNEELMISGMSNVTVVENNGNKIKVEFTILDPAKKHHLTMQVVSRVDNFSKEAHFSSTLVETDGFVSDYSLNVKAWETGGRVYVTIKVFVKIPQVSSSLIRLETKRSVAKMVRSINSQIQN